MTVTEKQSVPAFFGWQEKFYFSGIYRILPVSTTEKKNGFNSLDKQQKYYGTAHTLKPSYKTSKIVQQ